MRLALPLRLPTFHGLLPLGRAGRARIAAAPRALQQLRKGATLVLPQPRGVQLAVLGGQVWITHDGDCKDVVLAGGQSYASERSARMLVHGLEDATLLLR